MRSRALVLLLVAGGDFAAGVAAYEAGRHAEALEAFARAEREAGDHPSPELLFDKALAALGAGELRTAEDAAGRAAALGGAEFAALRDFMAGNAAFLRSVEAERETLKPLPPPSAFDVALAEAEAAQSAWQRAALSRPDWPAARRNVERALLRAEQLRQRKQAAEKDRQSMPEPRDILESEAEREQPEPPPAPPQEQEEREAPVELSREQLLALFERVDAKEEQRVALRRSLREKQRSSVERDW